MGDSESGCSKGPKKTFQEVPILLQLFHGNKNKWFLEFHYTNFNQMNLDTELKKKKKKEAKEIKGNLFIIA